MKVIPQFVANHEFHFREHGEGRRKWFMFGDDLHRRVSMEMKGATGLYTVGMWVDAPAKFFAGDITQAKCVVIASELYRNVVAPRVTFELWDGGFFATGTVLERCDESWSNVS